MRTSIVVSIVALALIVSTAACSSGSPRPATVRNYGPEASGTYAAAPMAPSQPAPGAWPSAAPAGPFAWHSDLASAQAAARSQGKLILAMSTKPGCGLCDKFKTQIVPQAAAQCQRIAVGFVYDIRPPIRDPGAASVDGVLRANLRGASLMPLVGFLTPDLRWVHGFWGSRSVGQFQGDLAQAQRIYPVSAGVVRTIPQGPTTASVMQPVLNEYGEPEWSLPGDVWPVEDPEPIDAITGAPSDTVDASQADAVLAEAPAAPAPPVDLPAVTAPAPVAAAPRAPAPPPATYVGIQPPAPSDWVDPAPLPPPAPIATEPAPLPPPAPIATRPAPLADAPAPQPVVDAAPAATDGEGWGERLLRRALDEIRSGRYDAARTTLDQVRTRLPQTTYAREAAKGCVALYNARRIQGAASGDERSRYLTRARRDLGSSMWGVLFES